MSSGRTQLCVRPYRKNQLGPKFLRLHYLVQNISTEKTKIPYSAAWDSWIPVSESLEVYAKWRHWEAGSWAGWDLERGKEPVTVPACSGTAGNRQRKKRMMWLSRSKDKITWKRLQGRVIQVEDGTSNEISIVRSFSEWPVNIKSNNIMCEEETQNKAYAVYFILVFYLAFFCLIRKLVNTQLAAWTFVW